MRSVPHKPSMAHKKGKRSALLRRWTKCLFVLAIVLPLVAYTVLLLPKLLFATERHAAVRKANYYLAWDISDATAKELARWDLLVLDMENQVRSRAALQKIRQLNPDIIILAYITSQEIRRDAAASYSEMRKKLVSGINEQWYLTDSNNNRITFWPGTWMLNLADNAPVVNGIRFNQYLATFVNNEIIGSGLWDGVFYDNAWRDVKWVSGDLTDLDKNGVPDAEVDQRWQNGMRFLFQETRRLAGNQYYLVGNATDNAYSDVLNGIMLESFPRFGWQTAMRTYAGDQEGSIQPRLTIINANTDNKGTQTSYRKMRYGLASALLLDGYYSFDFGDINHGQTWWYDEYDEKKINLGDPIGGATAVANKRNFEEDVWQREYENGLAVVNATNQARTVDLGRDYEKINGQQDPVTNDGSIVDSVTLPAHDGLLMMKTFQTVKNVVFGNGNFLRFYDQSGRRARNGFFVFEEGLPGGVRVFKGDLDGDQATEEKIVAIGPKMEIFNSRGNIWFNDYPLGANYKGQLHITVGAFDGKQKVIMVSGNASGKMMLYTYYGEIIRDDLYPFGRRYSGGFSVAVADVDGDKKGEVIVGTGKGKSAEVIVYSSSFKVKKRFFVDRTNRNGVKVAAGDINGDGIAEIVTALNYRSHHRVRTFTSVGRKLGEFRIAQVLGAPEIDVAVADVNFDGFGEIVASDPQ